MDAATSSHAGRSVRGVLVLVGAVALALVSARDYAGGWNDGSRLATVECLVDYHTLAIDQSIFVNVPALDGSTPTPFPADDAGLMERGTRDKLFIGGHFYSDKSPVPALLLAAPYQVWVWATGLPARQRPDWFCYGMTVLSSGLGYVVAVWSIERLGRTLRLPSRLLLTISFALATVALTYARHVNNHILLLGIAAALFAGLARLAAEGEDGKPASIRLVALGMLAGLGYTIDLGAGPVLLACVFAVVAYRCRGVGYLAAFTMAALPWLVLHHAVNYAVGGTLGPANAVPEYFQWPGCPFDASNLTGGWKHESMAQFFTYAAALLFGKRGFFGHDLPLFMLLPALAWLLRQRVRERPEIVAAFTWMGGTWLMYAVNSNNYSGACCTIRWFVPLLAPAYYVLGVFLRERPAYRADFLILSAWGMVLAWLAWWNGPWMQHMVPLFWPIQAAAVLSWAGHRAWRWREARRRPEHLESVARAA